ncbi:MAG: dihydrolipoyl dehydrogenase [Hyphomicrobiales bacterium]|nr:MAG: dihydrolipoyl dehydrogenase [Hyphomicrobiales bacterium]
MTRKVKACVIGAGSAGLFSLSALTRQTKDFVIVNSGHLGTTCARVGCMPSKVLIQAAEYFHDRAHMQTAGLDGTDQLSVDIPRVLQHVRNLRDTFVGGVMANFNKGPAKKLIEGEARFVAANTIEVNGERIEAEAFILATGSRPIVPDAWQSFADRILTTDSLFEQEDLPGNIAVLGLGAIGLEIGQALSRLGIKVTGVDMADTIGGLDDGAVRDEALKLIGAEFDIWLGAPAEVEDNGDGRLKVRAGAREVLVDKILVSLGRRPNIDSLDLAAAGVALDKRGMPQINPLTMQIPGTRLFVAGDSTGDRALLHEAGDEGRIAGFNALAENVQDFRRKTPLAIAFCDPNIAMVGARWSDLKQRGDIAVGERNFDTQARARVMQKNAGLLRIYGDTSDGRLLGAAMTAPRGEHLAHHLAWAIEQKLTVWDLLAKPFYHPVIEEGLQNALNDLASKVGGRPEGLVEVPFA